MIGEDSAHYEEPSAEQRAGSHNNKSAESSCRLSGEDKTDSTGKSNIPVHTPGPSDGVCEKESADKEKESADESDSNFTPITGWNVRVRDIWGLGITIVIGGQYFQWNAGLSAGFGSYAIATLLIATGYICLCCSVSELASTMPFAGGGYGK
jgi:hypothetical protein